MATVRIQLRRGTASQWVSANPTLAAGEMGVETDTRKVKIGDGVTAWTSLDYVAADSPEISEIAQDAINDALVAGTGITKSYDDNSNTITVSVDTSVIATKAELAEVAQDSINDALTAGTGLTKSYDDAANTLTVSVDTGVIATQAYADQAEADAISTAAADATSKANAAQSAAESTAAAALSSHESDTTGIHGIADTSLLATQAYADQAEADAKSYADQLITDLVGTAPALLNTLGEIADALSDDENFAATVTQSLNDLDTYKAPKNDPVFSGTVSLPSTTVIGDVSSTEISYLDGVTSGIQTQLDTKLESATAASTYAPIDAPVFTGTVTLPSTTVIGDVSSTEIGYLDGLTAGVQTQLDTKLESATAASTYAPIDDPVFTGTVTLPLTTVIGDVSSVEIGYLDGVTGDIQVQIDTKAPVADPVFTGTVSLPSTTVIGDVSSTEIAYLDGVTSAIQVQLDAKLESATAASTYAPLASPTFTGTVILPDDTVTAAMILDGTIGTSQIEDLAITSAKIANGTIVNEDISESAAIAQSKIANLTSDLAAKALDADLDAHTGATTSVHGISDTSVLVTLSGAQTLTGKTLSAENNTITINAADIVDVTASAAELNILDGVTATAAELNILDGVTASTTELNYVDGVTSAIQTQIDSKASLSGATFTGSVEIDQNLTVDGNLTVNGTTFSASSTSIVIEDNIVQLAHENAANTVDLGLVVAYNDGSAKHAGIVRDVSDAKWKLFKGVATEPSTTVAFGEGSLDDLAVAAFEATSATIGDVSNTELQYLNGVTSAIQTQIDAKAPIASPTFTGTVTVAASGIAYTDGTQTKEGVPSRTYIYGAANSNAITADTTLSTLAYRDSLVEVNSSSAVTLTVPPNSTAAFPIGASWDIVRMGSGSVTVAAGSGVTINYTPGNKLRAQYSSATLFKRGTDSWLLIGDLTA